MGKKENVYIFQKMFKMLKKIEFDVQVCHLPSEETIVILWVRFYYDKFLDLLYWL